ncbi:MAG: hypothetical protein Q7J65_05885 [Candidatus Marinimicrobia bacterium]|nr:hypothetical protein [Candidatus Neomarinimicrobiota bacterium]
MVRKFHPHGSNRGLIFFIFALILNVPDQNINHPCLPSGGQLLGGVERKTEAGKSVNREM